MTQRGFAAQLRRFLQQRAGETLTIGDMANGVDLDFGERPRRKLNSTVSDFCRRGELTRVAKGTYRYQAQTSSGGRPVKEKIWAILRARKSVTIADLQELAGASPAYAKEFLLMLAKREIVAHRGNRWVLVNDPVILPEDTEKAARLRRLREKKKALEKIDNSINALLEARLAVTAISEEGA